MTTLIGIDMAVGRDRTYVMEYSVNERGEVVNVKQEETLST